MWSDRWLNLFIFGCVWFRIKSYSVNIHCFELGAVLTAQSIKWCYYNQDSVFLEEQWLEEWEGLSSSRWSNDYSVTAWQLWKGCSDLPFTRYDTKYCFCFLWYVISAWKHPSFHAGSVTVKKMRSVTCKHVHVHWVGNRRGSVHQRPIAWPYPKFSLIKFLTL